MSELIDFSGRECAWCGRTSDEISETEGWDDDDFDNNSRTSNSGMWRCHEDCRK